MRIYLIHPAGDYLSLKLTGAGRWTDHLGRSHRLGVLRREGWQQVTVWQYHRHRLDRRSVA